MRRFIYGLDSFPDFPPYAPRYSRHTGDAGEAFEPIRRTRGRAISAKRPSKAKTLRSHRTGR